MVPQAWFEARTESSSNNTRNANDSSDPSWYALRNVIYAHGLRISMAGKMSFTEICQQSWNLFENALSVQLDIIYARTSLLGVQALILMVSSVMDFRTCTKFITRLGLPKALGVPLFNTCFAQTRLALHAQ